MFHAACVIGAAGNWRGLDLTTIRGRLLRDGMEIDSGLGGDLMGHPMASLAWLAGSPEASAFGGLRAGQVVMLGSVTPPLWLDSPARITVQFDDLPQVELTLA